MTVPAQTSPAPRRIGWILAAVAVAAAGAGRAGASSVFPGAPSTQPNAYGVETGACPLAPPNRYLPARSGCVTVERANVDGDGRADLILVYSHLSAQHPSGFVGGVPPSLRRDFVAQAAFLKLVLADGTSVSAQLADTRAAAIDAVARVNDARGREIFLEVGRISSGATGAAYGFAKGRLVSAGVALGYGGDSAARAGFDCLPGTPPRLVQRTFELIGPTVPGRWRETVVGYRWHGPKLVQTGRRTFDRRGTVTAAETGIGRGCIAGVR